ncbi:MAG: hypothetical protein WBE76_12420 [Terracidiphilus sp.]
MKWRKPDSPPAEDRFEEWFNRKRQESVLDGQVEAPQGPHPDDSFLRDLARKSRSINLSDPRVDHAASCPHCMRKLLALRNEKATYARRVALTAIIACCVLLVATVVWISGRKSREVQPAPNVAVVSRTLDLSNAGSYRGDQPSPLQSVSLPTAVVKVTVVLPRYSTPGNYVVAVTRDQSGSSPVAKGIGPTVSDGSREVVTVTLDLRSAKAGPHFLSTTREQDEASYYYPLDIQ